MVLGGGSGPAGGPDHGWRGVVAGVDPLWGPRRRRRSTQCHHP